MTDAISAAPHRNGEFQRGDRKVIVSHGAARLPDGTLAGSVLTVDSAIRNLVDIGVPWPEAVLAATAVPARLIGRPELGTLRPRTPADVIVLDERLHVTRTVFAGQEVWAL